MVVRRYLAWRTRTARPPVRLGTRAARFGALAVLLAVAIIAWPVVSGYLAGKRAAPQLAQSAQALIRAGQGPNDLGPGRWDKLLAVQDPGFEQHSGIDFTTPGAGITTVTQSLAKRVGFEDFRPGWSKLRQTGLALGYETGMTKEEIGALWLETVEMGRIEGPEEKGWTVGFWSAAERAHGATPAALDDADFRALVARLIAPAALGDDPEALAERDGRIARLWAGDCAPTGHGDVWLDGCAE
ncbi:transglycosylase domain-containing protein [Jannaschia marina]|uniref:transglycosylase domain-containing protein n=1 Tax=Jannaschia marina TaxID=2741674 RepID=UPI0015C99213|nr:transglycosylase domain-containing protein [Jannaschia marina]